MPSKNQTKPVDMMLDMMINSEKIPKRLVKVMSRARKRGENIDSTALRKMRGDVMDTHTETELPPPDVSIKTDMPDDDKLDNTVLDIGENIDENIEDHLEQEIEENDDKHDEIISDNENVSHQEQISDNENDENASYQEKISDNGNIEHQEQTSIQDGSDLESVLEPENEKVPFSENENIPAKSHNEFQHSDIDDDLPEASDTDIDKTSFSDKPKNKKKENKGKEDTDSDDDSDDSGDDIQIKNDDDSSDDDYYEDKAKKVGQKLDPKQERRLYRRKSKLLDKFDKLRLSYAKDQETIPDFNENSDYYIMKRSYKRIKTRLHRNASISNNQMYLIFLFIIIEWAFTSYLGMDIKGYAKDQTIKIDQYNRLMIELGEKSYITFGGRLPVEVRIIGIAVFNALIMFMLRKVNISSSDIYTPIPPVRKTEIKPLDDIAKPKENIATPPTNKMRGPTIRYNDNGERIMEMA